MKNFRLAAVLVVLAPALGFAQGQPGVEKAPPPKTRPYDPPFIIAGWCPPPATLERYKEYAECGFNLVLNTNVRQSPARDVELAKSVGLKTIIADKQLFAVKLGQPDFEKNAQAVIAKYKNDPSVVGLYLMDEPSAAAFPQLKALSDQMAKVDPRLIPFVNLLPTYSPPQALAAGSYEEYLRRYLAAVNPPFVCWDHFALLDNTTLRPDYFENLEIVARVCRERRLPFVQVICSVPHGMYRPQDEADIRWQAYTTIAYGARGIVYFTYATPPNDGWGYHDAMLNAKGEKTPRYGYAQRLNKKLHVLAPWLTKLSGVRVAHNDPLPRGGAGFDKGFPVASVKGGRATVGWLQDDANKDYLFVVNRHFGFYRSWINDWQLSGPYLLDGKTPLAPELGDGKDAEWKSVSGPSVSATGAVSHEGMMDLVDLVGGEKPNSAVYLKTRIKSPAKQDAILALGSFGVVKVWLNGKQVHATGAPRTFGIDQDKVKVTLEPGWNTLMVKAMQVVGSSRLCVRILDPNTKSGAPPGNVVSLEGLEYEGQTQQPDDVGTREFTLAIPGKATQISEISQETGSLVRAGFDPQKRTLTVKLRAGEGKLFKLNETGITFVPLAEFAGGKELELDGIGFVPEKADAASTGTFLWRRKGEEKFEPIPLVAAAKDRFKATVPADVTKGVFEYYLEVREAGEKPAYEPAQGPQAPFTATPDLTPPTIVPSLDATLAKSYRVSLGWKPATDDRKVVEYRVYRGLADKFPLDDKTQIGKLPAETLAFSDNAPIAKSANWYAVKAIDVVGREGEPRYLRVDVPDHQPPANTLKVVAMPSSKSVTVKWSGELEPIVAGFEIHRGTGKDGDMTKVGEVTDRKISQYVDKDTKFGTEYRYTVRPRSAAGLVSEPGQFASASPLRYLKRINCGGPEIAGDDGVPWEADVGEGHPSLKYAGSRVWSTPTGDPAKDIYVTERWSNSGIGYVFKVDPGRYEVVLYLSETNATFAGKGQRLFDVKINDAKVAEKVDVFTEAGGLSKPWQLRRSVEVKGNDLEIKLLANPVGPAIKALEIRGLAK